MVKLSARDDETLAKVELHTSTILCADHQNTPSVPRNLSNYAQSELRLNQSYCKSYNGRLLRHQSVLRPVKHLIALVKVTSPIMQVVFAEVHYKLHCGLRPQSYINGITLAGFCATGLHGFVQEQIDACPTCAEARLIIKGVSSLTESMKRFYGPDDFVMNTTQPNPMAIVTIDEASPFFVEDGQGGHEKIYIVVCVELLTYKTHLITLP